MKSQNPRSPYPTRGHTWTIAIGSGDNRPVPNTIPDATRRVAVTPEQWELLPRCLHRYKYDCWNCLEQEMQVGDEVWQRGHGEVFTPPMWTKAHFVVPELVAVTRLTRTTITLADGTRWRRAGKSYGEYDRCGNRYDPRARMLVIVRAPLPDLRPDRDFYDHVLES